VTVSNVEKQNAVFSILNASLHADHSRGTSTSTTATRNGHKATSSLAALEFFDERELTKPHAQGCDVPTRTEGLCSRSLHYPYPMDLYIHPLYDIVSKIFSSILSFSAPIHLLYHPLSTLSTTRPLVTLSKYIHSIHSSHPDPAPRTCRPADHAAPWHIG
jgi:hypothetical protein